jgi:FkbM family methyltransferase
MSIAAAKHVGTGGRIVSFEPSPLLLDVLSYHKRVNRLHQMQIVPAAISDADDGTVPFFLINKGLSSRNSLTIGPDNTPFISSEDKMRIDVPCTTLDSFVRSSGVIPDVVKIDVEGAELLVLEGAKRLLAVHRPVLIIGVHPYWLPRAHSVDGMLALLAQFDYKLRDQHVLNFQNSYLADYLFIP